MIYLDNAATTTPDPRVLEAMEPYLREHIGNPASIHRLGAAASRGVEQARLIVAEALGAEPDEIVFTSGGTEANNAALKGAAFGGAKRHVVTSAVEHPSVLGACEWLAARCFDLTVLPVDRFGLVDPAAVEGAIREDTAVVSIMHGNNETGAVEPLEEIGEICRRAGVLFHTDACQSFTKVRIDVRAQRLDLVSLNAHKLHGPRGVGALYVRRGTPLEPLLHGGGQEGNLRSGTLNTPAIVGFGKAVTLSGLEEAARVAALRDRFIEKIESTFPGASLVGPRGRRLCGLACFLFPGLKGKELLLQLDRRGIEVSAGSACSAGSLKASRVLLALGLTEEEARSAVRFSFGRFNTDGDADMTVAALVEIMKRP